MKGISKRSLFALVACAAVTPVFLYGFSVTTVEEPAVEDLLKIFGTYRSYAKSIGQAYLSCTPGEANKAYLMSLVAGTDVRAPRNVGKLTDVVRQHVREDFRMGRVVEIDGWVLSVTEARVCALASLSP